MFCIRYARLFSIYIQKHETVADNPPIKIYVNKIENRIIFKIKTGYYIEFLTSETMKLLESNKSKITKDKNDIHVRHLEITKVVFINFDIVNYNYQQDSRILCTFVPNKTFGQLLGISPKHFIFLKMFEQNFHILKNKT